MDRETVSASIITYNEEDNIRRCLESVKWCDEIIIVDSFSTDRTLDICREYTDKIHTRTYPGNIDQKNYAASLATGDWVLSLDADERVTPELREEILRKLKDNSSSICGYYFKRKAYLFGKWVKHCGWYPDYKLRLFRRNKGRFEGREPHDELTVEGSTRRMKGAIEHFTYKNLKEYVAKIERYSAVAASNMKLKSYTVILLLLLIKPPWKFFEFYFLRCGFLDGTLGFLICVLTAFSNFLKYAHLLDRRVNFTAEDQVLRNAS